MKTYKFNNTLKCAFLFVFISCSVLLVSCENKEVNPKVSSNSTVDSLGKYKVWNLYRTQDALCPACSTTPASLVIPYSESIKSGSIIKASNGYCYTVAISGFQLSQPTIELLESYSTCKECSEK
jgi:hypothetical protein